MVVSVLLAFSHMSYCLSLTLSLWSGNAPLRKLKISVSGMQMEKGKDIFFLQICIFHKAGSCYGLKVSVC